VATKQLEALGAGRHRVVAFASQTGGRASATVWQFTIPPVPGRLPKLSYGSEGPAVLELEQRLAILGYDVVPDTYYSGDTEHAVTAFQKVHGFTKDGVAGQEVRRRLARPLVPKPRARHGGSWVEIDLSRQVLFYFVNGRIFRILPISSGRSGWRTSTGSFIFERSITGWRQSRLGLLWNPFYFYGGQAVHGSLSVPPYAASHGCVRVTMSSMDRLIPLLEIGMPCEIYGDAP
jgi:peptidoglycan hydrolase-like protein with peptidoglycan-binding domain